LEENAFKNFGKSSRGHSHGQGLPKFFKALIYRAHRAVIFAIAQLPCCNCKRPPPLKTDALWKIVTAFTTVKDVL